jgi:uncharacterized protein YidB (DUF937 family)
MSFLDSILSNTLGNGNIANSPLRPILADILGGLTSSGLQGPSQPGLGGLLERFTRAGYGGVANSWVSNGPNQPIDPGALHQVFGQDQVNQWSQQTGLPTHDLLNQLSQFLPHAVNQMTPDGQLPQSADAQQGTSAFDGPGMP